MLPNFPETHRRHGLSLLTVPVAVALLAGSGRAADPGVSDVLLARSALTAFDADPMLRDLNLIVSVVDRVAVIGGPVPSAEHGKRAEAVVRGINGPDGKPMVAEVRNRCFVQAGPDPLLRAIAARVGPPRLPAADLPGIALTPRAEVFTTPFEPPPAVVEPGTTVVARKPLIVPPDVAGILLPPVPLSGSRPVMPVVPSPNPVVLTSTPPAAVPLALPSIRAGELTTAIEAVRKTESRFAGLSAELRDGTLIVAGRAPRASDAWDFAEAIRRVPGVVRVAVGAVDAK